jgi:hypothetical protein
MWCARGSDTPSRVVPPCFGSAPETVEAMVNAADQLMYQVKKVDKGCIHQQVF